MIRQLFAEFQSLLDPRRQEALIEHLASQVQIAETASAYRVTVMHDNVARPEDIAAEFSDSTVRLTRTEQSQTRVERDRMAAFSYYAEVFDRSVRLAKPVKWREHTINARPGVWELTIPKI